MYVILVLLISSEDGTPQMSDARRDRIQLYQRKVSLHA